MRYSEALEQLMNGKRIRNMKWNGKNAYLYYVPGRVLPASMWKECHDPLTDSERLNNQVEILGHIDMVTNDGKRLIGWLASQYDVQSEDWEVLE